MQKWLILLATILPLLYVPIMVWQWCWLWQMWTEQGAINWTIAKPMLWVQLAVFVEINLLQGWYIYDATRRHYPTGDAERGRWLVALMICPLLPNIWYWQKYLHKSTN